MSDETVTTDYTEAAVSAAQSLARGACDGWEIDLIRRRADAALATARRESDGWQHVAAYYLGAFADCHDPEECRAEALRRAQTRAEELAEATSELTDAHNAVLVSIRRELEEARAEARALGELSRSHQTERLRLERRLTEAEAIVRWFVDEYRPNKYVAPSVKDWYERARSFLNASVAPVVASGPAGDTEGGP